ncbi:MAG TPA: class I SAM-dependent methyltransferase [Pyrinomonadaceae bacterium]|nr:class I SAM-dependent methyltransferase [Pyrinomonadaceae bacterium]
MRNFFRFRLDRLGELKDPGLLSSVYTSFYTSDGTSKETSWDRFIETDEFTVGFLKQNAKNVIHDVGVSSGVTSLELYRKLNQRRLDFQLYVSDKFTRYYFTGKGLLRIYNEDTTLAQAYLFGLLLDRNIDWKYFLSKYAYYLVALLPKRSAGAERLCLYDLRLLSSFQQGIIHEIDYDLFRTRLDDRFDLVRCMNVLNVSYFRPAKILRAIRNLQRSLKNHGVLQIGRTNTLGRNEVSFFLKDGGNLRWILDVNGGSEIKPLVKSLN